MNLRNFSASGGLAAASPMLAQGVGTDTLAITIVDFSKRIDFTSDDLGRNPKEYAALFHEVTSTQTHEPDNYS